MADAERADAQDGTRRLLRLRGRRSQRDPEVTELLLGTGLVATLVKIGVVLGVLMTVVGNIVLVERKVAGWIQDRVGPNRAGPWGLLQPLADGIKFIFKEDIVPSAAYRPLYILAPALS